MLSFRVPMLEEPVIYVLIFAAIVLGNMVGVFLSGSELESWANSFGVLALIDTIILFVFILRNSLLFWMVCRIHIYVSVLSRSV